MNPTDGYSLSTWEMLPFRAGFTEKLFWAERGGLIQEDTFSKTPYIVHVILEGVHRLS